MPESVKFRRCDVERSFRKFTDLVNDLIQAVHQTWPDGLTRLLDHCENNPVMRVVTEPLRTNPNVNAVQWATNAISSVRGMVGSGRYTLPVDDDDQMALLYNFLIALDTNKIDFARFCIAVYGSDGYDDMMHRLNVEIVTKFAREVGYRLGDILTDTEGDEFVTAESMIVFHHHDHSTTITGNVVGSIVGIHGHFVTIEQNKYNSPVEFQAAIEAMRPLLTEVLAENRSQAEAAFNALSAASGSPDGLDDIKNCEYAKTVAEALPSLRKKLFDAAYNVGKSLSTKLLVEWIVKTLA